MSQATNKIVRGFAATNSKVMIFSFTKPICVGGAEEFDYARTKPLKSGMTEFVSKETRLAILFLG